MLREKKNSTPEGFEPSRAEPINLAGLRLNHSAKVSLVNILFVTRVIKILLKNWRERIYCKSLLSVL